MLLFPTVSNGNLLNIFMQWYEGDTKRIQFSCRHRGKSESEADLKIWDIGFPESDNDD